MANGVKVATAYVEVNADTESAAENLKKTIAKAGEDAGSAASKAVADRINSGIDEVGKRGRQTFDTLSKNIRSSMDSAGSAIANGGLKRGLDGIGKSAAGTKRAVDEIGSAAQSVASRIDAVGSSASKVFSGDTQTKVSGLADLMGQLSENSKMFGDHLGPIPGALANLESGARTVQGLAAQFRDVNTSLERMPGLAGKAGAALNVIAIAAALQDPARQADQWIADHVPGGEWLQNHTPDKLGKQVRGFFNHGPTPNVYQGGSAEGGAGDVPTLEQLMTGAGGGRVSLPPGLGNSAGAGATIAPSGYAMGGGGSKTDIARYIYQSAVSRGYSSNDAVAIVAYAIGESGLNPTISGGIQGDDEVIGLFQQKTAFAAAGGIDPSLRGTVEGNTTAYLNNLGRNRGSGDIYDQLLATSVGGPMYTGGRPYMDRLVGQARGILGFDDGGWWPSGVAGVNTTGKDELVLNPDHLDGLKSAGINPNSLLQRPPDSAQGQDQQQMAADAIMRTMGYLPAAGSAGGVAGTSSLARLFGLGNEVTSGLIDTGASAAEMAINLGIQAAAAGGSFGAGAAAGPAASMAASYGVQLAATEAKRAASYGWQLGAIWSDAAVEQLFPFGAPRWIGYDYTQFLPQLNISQIGTTTVEKAIQQAGGAGAQALKEAGVGPYPDAGGPVSPALLPGMQIPGAPVPQFGAGQPATPPAPGAGAGGGTGPAPGAPGGWMAPPAPKPAAPVPTSGQPFNVTPENLGGLLGVPAFDEGGWWPDGTLGINSSGRSEFVLSPDHLDSMRAGPPMSRGRGGDTYNIKGSDPNEIAREIAARQRLASLQYTGRPPGL
ncbi:hypothetical protein MSS4_04648 [Mycobacterium marinum]|uniref:hypothetical protein n=1 Tax=Mycobacterium marinum TaxID=1781 RepID=UPI000EE174FE|nr:hypothetical protein [Mycobacterium marinum]RFZ42683.1 hypothetical protein MSS4_04648 [Mycobacterium marinum]